MSYNKRQHLRDNIDAIKLAFSLDRENGERTDEQIDILKKYSGFGGIKAVLNAAQKPEDINSWVQSERDLFPLVQELHTVLRENTANDREYRNYVASLKNSILTAFYTPSQVVESINTALRENGVRPHRILDPSAGTGNFMNGINTYSRQQVTSFEKDLLTGKILKHLRPGDKVRIEGFENIEEYHSGHFDLVASNIPFGDAKVFDPYFNKHDDPIRHIATNTIHNYFFVKSFDMLREGGMIAFITSQGVMDSERNKPIREWLMDRCELVSAVRLPNNMFIDEAGTEVGSDFIVLQKHYANTGRAMTPRKLDFINSTVLPENIRINNHFLDLKSVVRTSYKVDTNPYGQPALLFHHQRGVEGIADDLRHILRDNIAEHLNFDLYNKFIDKEQKRELAAPYYVLAQARQQIEAEQAAAQEIHVQERMFVPGVDYIGKHREVAAQKQQGAVPQSAVVETAEQEQKQKQEQPFMPTENDWQQAGEAMAASHQRLWEQHSPQPKDFALNVEQQKREAGVDYPDYSEYYSDDWRERLMREGIAKRHERVNDIRTAEELIADIIPKQKQQQQQPEQAIEIEAPLELLNHEPLQTLYDLFGFTETERSQIRKPGKRNKKAFKKSAGQHDLFSAASPPETQEQREERLKQEEEKRQQALKPVPFMGEVMAHYREGSMIQHEDGRVGYLRELKGFQTMFHPLELSEHQRVKGSIYIELRDTYHHLYNNEAEGLEENPALRSLLNTLYDNFTGRFGQLNDKGNLDFIKMDAGGMEILSLENYIGGVAHKVDIFNHPVAFNSNELKHVDTPHEALAASLNKFGCVDLGYMAGLTDSTSEDILKELKEIIYLNPIANEYQIADKYISGNMVVKAEAIEKYLEDNPNNEQAKESLKALRDATPDPIAFDDLDFNFGERWIPIGIFNKYGSYLMNTEVNIRYISIRDEFTVTAAKDNTPQISEQFAVRGEFRKYNGIALLRHALHNTTPDITKDAKNAKGEKTKIRDGAKIQLANAKIEEIRNGFSEWLKEQTPEFKERLADTYNRKFNCFVRPKYDGSHQIFPGLDRRGLGIEDLYGSQKDAIWMDILNGGGIIDHEVGGGKTLIMCCGAYEKKRLGIVNKPLIIGLKANIGEIARTYATAYPHARIIYPGKEDFTPSKRNKIFNSIKNNDFDVVILTHEQFGKIPQSPEIMQDIFQAELDSVEENLQIMMELRGRGASSREKRGLEIRKQNLEVKLKTVADEIKNRKDDATDFRLMGVDHIYVDESHRFVIALLAEECPPIKLDVKNALCTWSKTELFSK